MSPEEKLIRIVSVVPSSSKIVFDHTDENGKDIYYAEQEYPHIMDMHNPFTFERVCFVVDKIDGEIVRSEIQFKDKDLNKEE